MGKKIKQVSTGFALVATVWHRPADEYAFLAGLEWQRGAICHAKSGAEALAAEAVRLQVQYKKQKTSPSLPYKLLLNKFPQIAGGCAS